MHSTLDYLDHSFLVFHLIQFSLFCMCMYLYNFTAARLKINEEFQKNKNEASEESIDKVKHPAA